MTDSEITKARESWVNHEVTYEHPPHRHCINAREDSLYFRITGGLRGVNENEILNAYLKGEIDPVVCSNCGLQYKLIKAVSFQY